MHRESGAGAFDTTKQSERPQLLATALLCRMLVGFLGPSGSPSRLGEVMKPALVALMVCSSMLMFAADRKPTAAVLERWVGGKWPLEGKMLDTDYSKATSVTGVSTCAWSPDHIVIICDQSFVAEGKPDRALSVYVFDPKSETFHLFGLSPSGERPTTIDITISADGSHWEYNSQRENNGKRVMFRTINEFRTLDYIDWWSEYSTDGQHWTRMGGGTEKRQK